MEKKNVLLQPIFRDLKSIIRHMTFTEEFKLIKEYLDNRAIILSRYEEASEKGKEGLAQLEREYSKLLKKQRLQLSETSRKLNVLQ